MQRVDEQARVSDLPASATTHEAPKLLLSGPSLPRRLLLEGAERSKLTLGVEDLFHGGGTKRADQLILQVCDAHVEPECFNIGPSEVGAKAGALEAALEGALLCGVTEARQSDVQPLRTEPGQEASDVRCATDRHDGDALSLEPPTTALGQRFERELVADTFNQDDRTCTEGLGQVGHVTNHGDGIRVAPHMPSALLTQPPRRRKPQAERCESHSPQEILTERIQFPSESPSEGIGPREARWVVLSRGGYVRYRTLDSG